MLVPIFATAAHWERTERGLDDGSLSIRDVLASQAALVRGDHADVTSLLRREVRVDPAFAAFARACAAANVPLTVVSSGVESIIRDRLGDFALANVPIVANAVDPKPDGWVMTFRDDVDNGTDKAAVLAAAARRGERTVFIGDGRSDYAAARAADVRFAKRGFALERYLTERNVPFEPFATFADVIARAGALGILPSAPTD